MYDADVPVLAAGLRADPETFARAVQFAILSIQQQFITLPVSMADVASKGDTSRYLFGGKRDAYRHLQADKAKLWEDVCALDDTRDALVRMAQSPGFGLVKGAFVLQMLGHDLGCYDTRNLKREGRPDDEWNLHGRKSGRSFDRKVDAYLRDAGGRARELWDTWCAEVGPVYGRTPGVISRMHRDLILPPGYEPPLPLPNVPLPFFGDDIPW